MWRGGNHEDVAPPLPPQDDAIVYRHNTVHPNWPPKSRSTRGEDLLVVGVTYSASSSSSSSSSDDDEDDEEEEDKIISSGTRKRFEMGIISGRYS